jgi:serine/threonine protein kinase
VKLNGKSARGAGVIGRLARREIRSCSACGNKFSVTSDGQCCPVCVLWEAAGDERGVTGVIHPAYEASPNKANCVTEGVRFEKYNLVRNENGTPIELGHGAMGITYKAFDVDLCRPVTLKVISARYLNDESARLRFLREARAAASLRHPNVASVFHLGKTGENYFYTMEFVEGSTLESLIKRSGRLEVALAIEITTQIAAGLAAVHKQRLVHRDIKPSNIMVSLEDEGAVTAKIIDLGLAKAVNEPGSQTAFSTPGCFSGTPEFASPEQFVGLGVDIRSDLYSLGVVLWDMVTGHAPFRGSPAELMYQHQYERLKLEELEGVPQPVTVLLEVLLDKDPKRRFQNPSDLLNAMPIITDSTDEGRTITQESLQKMLLADSHVPIRRPPVRLGPKKISVARLPVTGSDIYGREEDIDFLDEAWANQHVNVVTVVAWAGVGKSTLINHWLRLVAAEDYRAAELVFGWSFYRQGTSGQSSSADEFLETALAWFGDLDPQIGTAWEKGARLAKLISHRRTLLVLDGLEPLQYPPGPQEGRVREPSLQALLRELAAFNTGLCVITTRLPIADLADHERTSALRLDLEQLSNDAGAKLLRALGVKGHEAELRSASDEFSGHCLALTLLGSYLTDAYNGDIRYRREVSARLVHDVRQGAHARKVVDSYQTWFGEGPDLAVLRMLGLFDRPADEKALGVLLKPPAIPGLTESLRDLSPTEWRMLLARLRRARLLAAEDPHNPRHLDTHPIIREHLGEQLRRQQSDAWKECNRRLYHYYRTLAPDLPNSFREMEPLFSAVICGCNAGLFREALHKVYIPRIQRGDSCFAANALGATGPLLSVLVHFFEYRRWESPFETGVEEQSLTAEDQLFILMQAAKYLTNTRGLGAPEARICYERAEPLCHSLNQPRLLCLALRGQFRYCLMTDKLSFAFQIAERDYSLAQEQNDPALMIGACAGKAATLFFLGDFESSRQYAMQGVQIWRFTGVKSHPQDVDTPVVACLCHGALSEWHLGEIGSCKANINEAISLARKLNDMHALAFALNWAAKLGNCERNPAEVDRLASELIELSTRYNFVYWLAIGSIWRGWARSASADTTEGIPWIEQRIRDYRATGLMLRMPYFLAQKAEALYLSGRASDALEAINEAQALAEQSEEHWWCAELHRLRGVFLTAIGADEVQIESSFCEAIRIAKKQRSASLEKRAKITYADYRKQKARASGGGGFRLPLWKRQNNPGRLA